MDLSGFILEGHRGVQSLYPENTLASFRKARDLGLQWVELDLLSTSDGQIIIHHDFEIQGRRVYSLSFQEIQEIDVGMTNTYFPEQNAVPGAKIPRLAELFENEKNLFFNLEIKSHPHHPEFTPSLDILAQKILEIVREFRFQDRVYYSSFNPAALRAIRVVEPNAVIAMLYVEGLGEDWLGPIMKICKDLKAQIVSPLHTLMNHSAIQALKNAGLKVIPWTVNDPARYKKLVDMGVDGIISDYPQLFI